VTRPEIRKYCRAKLFSAVGKRTPVAVRFSTVGGESGSADTARDPRGFAIKFYTEEGRWLEGAEGGREGGGGGDGRRGKHAYMLLVVSWALVWF
jgi:hypothetical protein